mmetsp:Transcript_30810/g.73396  ORF Transcript_30810/g.73396 Transcript_30810/m.73396 type:complete len:213 (-) Transcript_30810:85-723(-)
MLSFHSSIMPTKPSLSKTAIAWGRFSSPLDSNTPSAHVSPVSIRVMHPPMPGYLAKHSSGLVYVSSPIWHLKSGSRCTATRSSFLNCSVLSPFACRPSYHADTIRASGCRKNAATVMLCSAISDPKFLSFLAFTRPWNCLLCLYSASNFGVSGMCCVPPTRPRGASLESVSLKTLRAPYISHGYRLMSAKSYMLNDEESCTEQTWELMPRSM